MKKLVYGVTVPISSIFLQGQIRYFTRKGYSVYLMTSYNNEIEAFCREEGCVYLRVNTVRNPALFKDIAAFFQILRWFVRIRPDIVNLGTPKMGLLGMAAAWAAGIRHRVFTCHGLIGEKKDGRYPRGFLTLIDRLPGMFATKIVCVSPSIKEMRENCFGETKCVVAGKGSCNGFDLSRFSPGCVPAEKTEELRVRLSLMGCFVFGFVGRIVDEKGIRELYDGFSLLYETRKAVKLLMIGRVEYESVKDRALLDALRNHPGVVMAGEQTDMPVYFSLMDVFVLPAWSEGFGNVLVEAAAMGVPVISTGVTGCKDAVCDGHNGVLVPPRDSDALAAKMLTLYEDEGLRKQYGHNGIEWAKNFRSEIVWEGLEKIYSDL